MTDVEGVLIGVLVFATVALRDLRQHMAGYGSMR